MHPRLDELLTATRECSQRLLEVLQDEDLALRRTDADRIDQITAAKQALVREMESYQAAQDRFLATHKIPPGPRGMEDYLQTLPGDAPERATWRSLQTLIDQCRNRNRINGGLVALSRQHVQQALEILKGSPETGPIYGRNGEALSATRTSPLAKA